MKPDKEAVLRAFARALHNEVPAEYVFGLDMGLTENDAAILSDELGRGSAVGTPQELGGLPYDTLGITGYGVAEATHAAAEHCGITLESGARVAIQGFGAVGAAATRRLDELGAAVVAISTARGVSYDGAGFDVRELSQARETYGEDFVHHVRGTSLRPGEEFVCDADILIPAAMQDVIDADVANAIKAQLVVEGANLPTNPEAQRILNDRGIPVVPDFIANAGGVIAAGFAMDARHSAFRPELQPVLATVANTLRGNTERYLEIANAESLKPHQAARSLAMRRVRDAMTARGQLSA